MAIFNFGWCLLLILGAACTIVRSEQLFGRKLNPLTLFWSINALSLFAYHTRLIPLRTVSLESHLLLTVSLLGFTVGCLIAAQARSYRQHEDRPGDGGGLGIFFYTIAVLSAVGWMLPLGLLVRDNGIMHLWQNPWLLQEHFQMQFIGYLNLLSILVPPTALLKRAHGMGRRKDLVWVSSAVLGLFLAGIKSYLVYSVVATVLIAGTLKRSRLHGLCSLMAIIGLAGYFYLYDQVIDIYVVRDFAGQAFPESLAFLQRPYYYFAGSWPAMSIIVDNQGPVSPIPGYVTLQPLWKLLSDGVHMMPSMPQYYPYLDVGARSFNVYNFTGEIYWDYGVLGVAMLSLLIGFVATLLFNMAYYYPYWGYKLLYGIFAYGVFLSFFAYYYKSNMAFLLLVAWLLAFSGRRRRAREGRG